MAVSPGDRLGRYEILSLLGRGGMGEVYKARDIRLDRLVAVKVLVAPAASRADRLARFEREARAISALDHPNICALYDVGEANGVHFIVIQYLEGQTLAERLTGGAMPLSQVIRHGTEIADALDRAHRAGIVHRDLKPANIMLTKSGAKLLDFGLAKLHDDSAPLGLSSLTRLGDVTADGMILGTYQYMAPEQVEGRPADPRTDIFALGAVLYEALTGNRAFPGPTAASVIGAILKDDPPPITVHAPLAPAALEQLVQTCLAKDPDDRWQSTADVKRQLNWIASTRANSDAAALASLPLRRRAARWWLLPAALAIALALTLPAALRQWQTTVHEPQVVRFPVFPPPNTTFAAAIGQVPSTQFAVSPDGHFLTFVATSPGRRSALWVRAIDSTEPTLLAGTDDASYPFWSHDSRFIAFFSQNQLKRVDRTGGSPREICEVGADPRGGAWNQTNLIVFARDTASGLSQVNADGGTPASLLDLRAGENSYRWPAFLPDGRRFLFHMKASTGNSIHLGSLDSRDTKVVLDKAPYAAVYSLPGYLLTVRDGALLGYPFDENALAIVGDGILIADHVGGSTSLRASFSASPSGVLAYAGPLLTPSRLEWFDREGKTLGNATDAERDYVNFRLSPDGRRAAVTQVDQKTDTTDIWLLDVSRKLLDRFTDNPATDTSPIWSRDGTRILFRSDRAGGIFPFERPPDRSTPERQVASVETYFLTDWSPDDKLVAFHSSRAATGSYDAGVLTLEEGPKPRFVGETKSTEMGGSFSPDRRWFAYSSDNSGEMEVYVGPYAGGTGQRVSNSGGSEPHWRQNGKELFYLAADRWIMSVAIGPGTTWAPGTPQPLFRIDSLFAGSIFRTNYDVNADGSRFLVIKPVEGAGTSPITVVLNWAAGLKR